nr:hypothetical protein [Nitrosopumilus sp.]
MTQSILFNAFCYWQPAVDHTAIEQKRPLRFKVDKDVILIRSIAITAIACIVVPLVFKLSFFWVVPTIIIVNYKLPLSKMLDKWRALRTLNELAVQLFNNSEVIPREAISFASESPAVVKELFSQDSFKNSGTGFKFTNDVLNFFLSCNIKKQKSKFGNVLKAIIENGTFRNEEINHSLLSRLVKDELTRDSPLVFGIEKDYIGLADLTDGMVRKLWSDVKNHKNGDLADLFVKKGFNIDLPDENGKTLLLEAIEKNIISQVCFLLKYGAELPQGRNFINVKGDSGSKNDVTICSLEEFIKDKPSLKRASEQASELQAREPFKLNHEKPSSFAFWKPAVKIGSWRNAFQVNGSTIYGRALAVGVISLIAAGILYVMTSSIWIPLAFTVIVIPSILYLYKYEQARATWAINNIAIAEFGNAYPFSGVVKYIASNPELLQQVLKDDKTAPFKFDDHGKSFWNYICKYNNLKNDDVTAHFIFRTLANSLFSKDGLNPLSKREKKEHFVIAIKSGSLEFVEYLLSKNKIQALEFDSVLQFESWQNVKLPKMVSMFVDHGFDINARSNEG